MGLDGVRRFLRRHSKIALDSSIFIYQLEGNPRYLPLIEPIFAAIERRDVQAVTSTLTMTEVLVPPYRASDPRRVGAFYALLSTHPNLEWIAPDLEVADIAAGLRAAHGFRTPGALQAATAVYAQATGLVTNDQSFRESITSKAWCWTNSCDSPCLRCRKGDSTLTGGTPLRLYATPVRAPPRNGWVRAEARRISKSAPRHKGNSVTRKALATSCS